MKRIGVTGAHGRIGSRLVKLGCDPLSFDVTNRDDVWGKLRGVKYDLIIHTAGISSVDTCQNDMEKAILVNTRGTNVLCEIASDLLGDGHVVFLSTDQVFDGKKGNYKENDVPNPINNYGLTKFAAEGIVSLYDGKVIRISRGFDSQSTDIKGYLEKLALGERVYVPDFLYRSYCHLDYLAQGIWNYANRIEEMPEILHLGGTMSISFWHFMKLIKEDSHEIIARDFEIDGCAPRPYNCGLNVSLARKLKLPLFTPYISVERFWNE